MKNNGELQSGENEIRSGTSFVPRKNPDHKKSITATEVAIRTGLIVLGAIIGAILASL